MATSLVETGVADMFRICWGGAAVDHCLSVGRPDVTGRADTIQNRTRCHQKRLVLTYLCSHATTFKSFYRFLVLVKCPSRQQNNRRTIDMDRILVLTSDNAFPKQRCPMLLTGY